MIIKAKDKIVGNKRMLLQIANNYRCSPTYSVRDSKSLNDHRLIIMLRSNCPNCPRCHWQTPSIKFKQVALILNQLIMLIKSWSYKMITKAKNTISQLHSMVNKAVLIMSTPPIPRNSKTKKSFIQFSTKSKWYRIVYKDLVLIRMLQSSILNRSWITLTRLPKKSCWSFWNC